MKNRQYSILNYGCQMNESDAEHFAGQLAELGYSYSEDYHNADIVVVNTCCVRESAEKKILGKIGEFKGIKIENTKQILCLAGCMAQKGGEALLKKYPQIDLLIGTAQVNNFKPIILNYLAEHGQRVHADMKINEQEFEGQAVRESTYAAWIPIMYGCNNFCTYCIVPHVRGRERSRSKENIIAEIEKAVAAGYLEFTLLGQNVNSYGKDLGNSNAFAELLKACSEIKGVKRLRYMTSHPRDMNEEVIKIAAQQKSICKHFHVPVQAGSNKILKAMNRGYTKEKFLSLIAMIRKYAPDAAITTDIIVGFPGESDADFNETLELVKNIEFDAAYTFIYSKRSGTPAANFEEQIPLAVKKARLNQLMEIQNINSLKKNKELEGTVQEVIVEGPSKNNSSIWSGRTGSNKLVLWPMEDKEYKIGDLVKIKITAAQTWLLKGIAENE
ncbi:MAG TPA: tRNA (N6-isopentenyl adenosine(37)-C2)-methylthiotransferase MiaB [Candidatus Avacidaminococcus intestinavium]|uniref:tRNA-2-methylthio-N(6)-dimethylallyladenosine synthase n=1 Tax=Candidatus Avacidaminococcus intestinavium TaxID=2840684 RepID=A0A9D1SLV6_9FIRM|nr:tRNA (N6-isopentenyl adenosine(37)-C2)-methylthiotransferase MiaB [Candidatus Avacidaminococcus intestinavium]